MVTISFVNLRSVCLFLLVGIAIVFFIAMVVTPAPVQPSVSIPQPIYFNEADTIEKTAEESTLIMEWKAGGENCNWSMFFAAPKKQLFSEFVSDMKGPCTPEGLKNALSDSKKHAVESALKEVTDPVIRNSLSRLWSQLFDEIIAAVIAA